jgi:nitrogen fixation protein NifU and related proteins
VSGGSAAFRAAVLEHFRRPRNRGTLDAPSAQAEGANPLCGDRVRIQIVVAGDVVTDARFTADACAICVASASVLTDHVRGLSLGDARAVETAWVYDALEGEPPSARRRCALLPFDTLKRALADVRADGR